MQNADAARSVLEKEKALLEKELVALGARSDKESEWVIAKPEGDEFGADRNDNADIMEDMEENSAAASELEGRLKTVELALEKIDSGAYGTCEVCGNDIEQDRLGANPAALTCKEHMQ